MATPPDSPGPEEALFEFESSRVRLQATRPVAIEELLRLTKFTRQEICVMYRGFKQIQGDILGQIYYSLVDTVLARNSRAIFCQTSSRSKFQNAAEAMRLVVDDRDRAINTAIRVFIVEVLSVKLECPEGVVQEDSFKDIYAKFFPHGNSSIYAHYVFKAFDVNSNGAINFRDLLVTLSTLLRGSIYEKLRWTFKLYDINGDGCISRGELGEVVTAVHELMGRKHPIEEARQAKEQLDRVFEKLDLNHDGVITIEEFIESCLKDEVITRSLAMFDCEL